MLALLDIEETLEDEALEIYMRAFLSYKGDAEQEVIEAQNAIKVLGLSEPPIIFEELPGNDKRAFINLLHTADIICTTAETK